MMPQIRTLHHTRHRRPHTPESTSRYLEKESPRMAKNYDETDPENRPLNRKERRALRDQDRRFAERRRACGERAQKLGLRWPSETRKV